MSRNIESQVAAVADDLRRSILEVLREVVAGRNVLLFGSAAGSELVRHYFADCGAAHVVDLACTSSLTARSISMRLQLQDDELERPSDTLCAELSSIDPERRAVVYAGSYVSAEDVDGRRVLGRRRPEWKASEKKRHQCTWTDGQGGYVPVYLDFLQGMMPDDLLQYCAGHLPCVVSGDPRECVAMGADYVYLLQKNTPFSVLKDVSWLLFRQCEGARVAPLTEGLPVTYYGFISADRIILYGPVEALVGFHPDGGKVIAPGILIPADVSAAMRPGAQAHVVRLVSAFAAAIGYHGAFGIDGSLTVGGLVVHELNTRLCAGFSLLSRLYGGNIPFSVIDLIIRETGAQRCGRVLALLSESAATLRLAPDVKLWENSVLEYALRQRMPPSDNIASVQEWKALVRKAVLDGNTPLYAGL